MIISSTRFITKAVTSNQSFTVCTQSLMYYTKSKCYDEKLLLNKVPVIKIGKNVTEVYELIKLIFEDFSLNYFITFDWLKHFKESPTEIEDSTHSGRQSIFQKNDIIAIVREKIRNDH